MKLPGGEILRGGRDCIFPVEVRPFLTDNELQLKGDWKQCLQVCISWRIGQCKEPGETMYAFLTGLGYSSNGFGVFHKPNFPWFEHGHWENNPIKLARLMAELDMGD